MTTTRPAPFRAMAAFMTLILFVALASAAVVTATTARAAELVGANGSPVTLVDSHGNELTIQMDRKFDGTGHGGAAQCSVSGTKPDNPLEVNYPDPAYRDDAADDGVVCIGDAASYEISWSVRTLAEPMEVTFDLNALLTQYPGMSGTKSSLSTGSSDAFTRSGGAMNPVVTYGANKVASGTFDLNLTEIVASPAGEILDVLPSLALSTDTDTATISDTGLRIVGVGVLDALTSMEPHSSVEIDGSGYIVFESYTSISSRTPEKGHYNASALDTDFELTFTKDGEALPAGVLQGTDATGAGAVAMPAGGTVEATAVVRPNLSWVWHRHYFFVPTSAFEAGVVENFSIRADAPDGVTVVGNPWYGQGARGFGDPGVGIPCTTSTAVPSSEVFAGAYSGHDGYPNNNCARASYKLNPGGEYIKLISDGISSYGTHEGRTFYASGLASEDYTPDGGSIRPSVFHNFSSVLRFDNTTPTSVGDVVMCDVWAPGDQMFFNGNAPGARHIPSAETLQVTHGATAQPVPLSQLYPSAQVFFTTQNLVPTSGGGPANCGDASDWTQDPSGIELGDVTGVKVVLGDDIEAYVDLRVIVPMIVGRVDHYETYRTDVTDYSTFLGSMDDQEISISDSSFFVAQTNWVSSNTTTDILPGTAAAGDEVEFFGFGSTTVNGPMDPANPVEGTWRIYLDRCLEDVEPAAGLRYVHVPEDDTSCGLGASYLESTTGPNDFSSRGQSLSMRVGGSNYINTATISPLALPGTEIEVRTVIDLTHEDSDYYHYEPAGMHFESSDVVVVESPNSVGLEKHVLTPVVREGEPYTYRVHWWNYTEAELGEAQVIDVLPYEGDGRGTDYTGTTALSEVEYVGSGSSTTTFEGTIADPSTINKDPRHASNQTGGATLWCAEADFGSTGCPDSLGEVTALRFTTEAMSSDLSQVFDLTFTPTDNLRGDKYWNSLGEMSIEGRPLNTLESPNRLVEVIADGDLDLSGHVYWDRDENSARDDEDSPVSGMEVSVTNTESGRTFTTQTDSDGAYMIEDLPSGPYTVTITYTDPYTGHTQVWTDTTIVRDSGGAELTADVTLEDENVGGVDFGLLQPTTSIKGKWYYDLNKNGSYDAGVDTILSDGTNMYDVLDPDTGAPVPGATGGLLLGTTLSTDSDEFVSDSDEFGASVIDENGDYTIGSIPVGPGTYSSAMSYFYGFGLELPGAECTEVMGVEAAAGMCFIQQGTVGTVGFDALVVMAQATDIDVPGGSGPHRGYDFGIWAEPSVISGTVYEDLNADGDYDAGTEVTSDKPVPGQTVTLTPGPGNNSPSQSTETDENGNYEFTAMPGEWIVTYEVKDPHTGTSQVYTSTTVVDGTGPRDAEVTSTSGETTDVDFGLLLPAGELTIDKVSTIDDTKAAVLESGSAVTWNYIVKNVGGVPVTGIAVADDQGVTVECPSTELLAGAEMTCTGTGPLLVTSEGTP